MILTVPSRFMYEKGKGSIDFTSDAHKLVLLAPGFSYSQSLETYADVSGEEISGEYGYTTGGLSLVVESAWAKDTVNEKASISWEDLSVEASGEALASFCAGVIINDTNTNKLITASIELEETISLVVGQSYTFTDLGFDSTKTSG